MESNQYVIKVEGYFKGEEDALILPFPATSIVGVATSRDDAYKMIHDLVDAFVDEIEENEKDKVHIIINNDGWLIIIRIDVGDETDRILNEAIGINLKDGAVKTIELCFGCLELKPNELWLYEEEDDEDD